MNFYRVTDALLHLQCKKDDLKSVVPFGTNLGSQFKDWTQTWNRLLHSLKQLAEDLRPPRHFIEQHAFIPQHALHRRELLPRSSAQRRGHTAARRHGGWQLSVGVEAVVLAWAAGPWRQLVVRTGRRSRAWAARHRRRGAEVSGQGRQRRREEAGRRCVGVWSDRRRR